MVKLNYLLVGSLNQHLGSQKLEGSQSRLQLRNSHTGDMWRVRADTAPVLIEEEEIGDLPFGVPQDFGL